jgi:hypothetical protein
MWEKPKYCKGCVLWNAGKQGTKYASWCCKHSMSAVRAVGHCITMKTKRTAEESVGGSHE